MARTKSALGEFFNYYDELLGTLRRRVSRHDAEDIAHDALLKVMENGSAAIQPRAYLHQTARNLMVDNWRRRATHETVELDETEEIAVDAGIERTVLAREYLAIVEAALAELPLKCRQVFLWHRVDGLKQVEIARRLNISKNMVEKYMIRAMVHLRDRMAAFDSH